MSETLRELVVRLSLDSGNFSSDMKGIATAVKQADANFKASGAGVKNYEKTLAGARAKVQQLTQTLDLQHKAVGKHTAQVEANKKKLEDNQKRQEKWAEKIKAAQSALDDQIAATGKDSEAAKELASKLKTLEGQQTANEKSEKRYASSVQKSELALTQAETAVKQTQAALKDANKEADKAALIWNRFGAATEAAQQKLSSAGQKMTSAGHSLTMGVTLPIAAAAGAAGKAAIDWETASTGVEKTVTGTKQQMKALHDGILDMSKVIPPTANSIAQVAENAGQLGIETDNILKFTRTMVDLGETTNLSADEGAVALAQFANITKMAQGNFDRLGSTIVDLGNNYATTENDIVNMATRLAAAGKQVKMTEADIMGVSTALASVGLEAEAGGSAISKVWLNIDMAAAKGGKAIKAYASVAGMSAKDFAAAWKEDAAQAFTAFVSGLGQVEAKGGNVGLTLEKLGYTEVRTRDSLLRLAGSGNVLSGALSTANAAWEENVALTNEANKRYGTTASRLQILKNKTVAAGISFGKAMTPHLNSAIDAASGLIDRFSQMDEGQQKLVLTLAATAAGIGPVLSGFGKLATGASAVMKFMSGPAGWITLAVAGLAALGVAIASIETDAEKMDKSLKGIKMTVDPESKSAITTAINAGIAAADKLYAIKVAVDADTEQLQEQLEAAFADGKFTKREYNAAKKFVDEVVSEDITKAKESLKTKVDDFRATLDGAVDELGAPVFSEERKAELTAAVSAETTNLIAQLEGYQKDYNALLGQLQKKGISSATEEELKKLQDLTELIAGVRVQLQTEQEQAILIAQAYAELAKSGEGGQEALGQGAGLVMKTAELDAEKAKKEAEAQMVENQKIINASREQGSDIKLSQEELQVLLDQNAELAAKADASIADIYGKSQKELQGMLDAYAEKYPEAKAELERWGEIYDALVSIGKADEKIGSGDGLNAEDYKSIFTPGIISKFFSDTPLNDTSVDKLFESGAPMAVYLDQLVSRLKEEVETGFDDETVSPLSTAVNSWLDSGFLEDVDITKLEGALGDLFKTADLSKRGIDVGQPIVDGAVVGVNEAGANLSGADFDKLKSYFVGALNEAFGINSPAESTKPSGRNITAGLAEGIMDGKPVFIKAIRDLYTSGIAEVERQEALLRNAMQWLQRLQNGGYYGGGVSSTGTGTASGATKQYNASATLQIENYYAQSSTDVEVLTAQQAALIRRAQRGYGA